MRKDLLNTDLFGNEAGEDENKERLNEYYLEKEINAIFFDEDRNLEFVRARKGVGKSALLNYAAYKIEEENKSDILLNIKATELISLYECNDYNPLNYTNCWQQRICMRIIGELAKKIKFAASDDTMTIIESAEIMGYKGKNIVSALAQRLKIQMENLPQIEVNESDMENSFELLKRYLEKKDANVWIFVDDIDATFINDENNIIMVGTFFTACRYLANAVYGLKIRASVRTDVWTILRNYDEALDKCEQYMLDLQWSTRDTGEILARKIVSYFSEHYPTQNYNQLTFKDDEEKIFNLVFDGQLRWGKGWVIPYRAIHILSAGRPRWAAQLCKLAARDAYNKRKEKINSGHISVAMNDYGKYRMSDLYKEHKHQCDYLEEVIEIFRQGKRSYTTKEILNLVRRRIITREKQILIDNKDKNADEYEIAKFLYRIGFVTLRNDEYNKALGFTRYEEDPYLFSEYNSDNDLLWEIHPAYRTVLKIE